jgi:hypothetical protein
MSILSMVYHINYLIGSNGHGWFEAERALFDPPHGRGHPELGEDDIPHREEIQKEV